MFLTPIFQIPDEASHFSLIQIIAETGKRPNPRRDLITSQEVFQVSKIIRFNWKIQHPVRQDYSGNWYRELTQISPTEKNNFVRNPDITSLKRPPLYYWLGSLVYRLTSSSNFLIRFFSLRSLSLIINILTVWVCFKLAGLFFKDQFLSLAVASLVAFQPLLSFIGNGVHYDSLTILVATVFLHQALVKHFRWAFFLALLGIFINPNLICLFLIFPFLFSWRKLKLLFPLGLVGLVFILLSRGLDQKIIYLANLNEFNQRVNFFLRSLISGKLFNQFWQYLLATGKINLAQVFPWYWGVFGWLEKTMPLIVYKIIKIVILVSLIGWLKFIISRTKIKGLWLLILASVINLGVVVLNDFLIFAQSGDNFGIQGRYLLPLVSAHMILLVFGLSQLIPTKYHHFLAAAIIIASFILNLIGLASLYQFFGWVWS